MLALATPSSALLMADALLPFPEPPSPEFGVVRVASAPVPPVQTASARTSLRAGQCDRRRGLTAALTTSASAGATGRVAAATQQGRGTVAEGQARCRGPGTSAAATAAVAAIAAAGGLRQPENATTRPGHRVGQCAVGSRTAIRTTRAGASRAAGLNDRNLSSGVVAVSGDTRRYGVRCPAAGAALRHCHKPHLRHHRSRVRRHVDVASRCQSDGRICRAADGAAAEAGVGASRAADRGAGTSQRAHRCVGDGKAGVGAARPAAGAAQIAVRAMPRPPRRSRSVQA